MILPIMAKKVSKTILSFQKLVWQYYKKEGRSLPWRKTKDPYFIMVSEFMLQQTQVGRVVDKYSAFIKKFPTIQKLAKAPLSDVIILWQGLGYNRRAKYLHDAAKQIVEKYKGVVPHRESELTALPGIGVYTARAIGAFAFSQPSVVIETNIRSVFIYHFFKTKEKVSDKELLPLIQESLDMKNPREWYFALMDYGTHIKQNHGSLVGKSLHFVKQKPFKGSEREVRGKIVRLLVKKSLTKKDLETKIGDQRVSKILIDLCHQGLICKINSHYSLPK